MNKAIDFTRGCWGHAMHGFTFHEVKDCGSWLSRLFDKVNNRRRYSVSVHSSVSPKIGDRILYKSSRGVINAELYDYKHGRDPKDMYVFYLMVDDKIEDMK